MSGSLYLRWAKVLAQLRTGMSHLNDYLYCIGATESDQCACGQAKEAVKHFLFTCRRWTTRRLELWGHSATMRGCLSCYLGGKNAGDTTQPYGDQTCMRYEPLSNLLFLQYVLIRRIKSNTHSSPLLQHSTICSLGLPMTRNCDSYSTVLRINSTSSFSAVES